MVKKQYEKFLRKVQKPARYTGGEYNEIIKELQKPYCCLKEPIKVRQYQLSQAVYILIAGIMPYITALILGDFIFVFASFICMLFVGGDILFFVILFGVKKDSYVMDFEGIIFYRVYEKNIDFEKVD